MFRLTHVVLIGLAVLVVAYWWRALAAREVALRAVRQHCERLGVQLLDDTVALRGLWLRRKSSTSLGVWRAYAFEFSVTGGERYSGRITMIDDRVLHIELPPHRLEANGDGDWQ
jgi:hypothetical protein